MLTFCGVNFRRELILDAYGRASIVHEVPTASAPRKLPSRKLTKVQKQKQQAEGLARVVQGITAKMKRFQ